MVDRGAREEVEKVDMRLTMAATEGTKCCAQ